MNTELSIEEGNKLIAEFMGLKFDPHKKDPAPFYREKEKDGWVSKTYFTPKYNSSWDWLMPVVEKIAKLGYRISIYLNPADNSTSIEKSGNPEERLTSVYWSTPMKATYDAVVSFIQWLNKEQTVQVSDTTKAD